MKLAAIAPPQNSEYVLQAGLGYHLILGQKLLMQREYLNTVLLHRRRGAFIMMDNGAAEGEPLTIEQLLEAASLIHSDEIILPDVLRNMTETIHLVQEAFDRYSFNPAMCAVVPQGNSIIAWAACAMFLVLRYDFATLCVPKHLEAFPGGRAAALKLLPLRTGPFATRHIHLLGIYEKPFAEPAACAQVCFAIRGIDTGAPIAYAQNSTHLRDDVHFSLDWKGPRQLDLAFQNISEYAMFLNGEVEHES